MSKAVAVTDATFDDEVLKADTLVLVDFWASWCSPCRMVAPILDQIAEEYAGKVKVVKVEVDSNQGSAAKYGVRSIPSLAIFKGGQVVDMLVGARPKAEIAEKLDSIL